MALNTPPNTQTFDPINCKSSIVSGRYLAPIHTYGTPSYTPSSGDSTLVSISQILSSFASITQMQFSHQSLPTIPTHSQDLTASSTVLLPVINTPSKLHRFLEYAETHLGIPNAWSYKQCLEEMGYAPNILHLVDNSTLKDIGIKPGDVICLKQNSLLWLNSFSSKCKQDNHVPFAPSTPPNKMVCFEKQFYDGGAAQVYGLHIVDAEGNMPKDLTFDWFYFCKACDA